MNQIEKSASALRRALVVDSVATGAMGVGLIATAGVLGPLLGISETFLRLAGGVLLPFTGLLIYLARQRVVSERMTWVVILGNALWVVDSVLVLAARWVQPNMLGTAFVLAQAAAVAVFAFLEYRGLRQVQGAGSITV